MFGRDAHSKKQKTVLFLGRFCGYSPLKDLLKIMSEQQPKGSAKPVDPVEPAADSEENPSTGEASSLLSHLVEETVGKGKSKAPSEHGGKYLIAGSLIVLAALVVIFAGVRAAQSIVGPFLLAGFLAVILTAPLRWLKSRGFSDTGAYLTISAAVLICGVSIIWILSGSVNRFIVRLPEYTVKFNKTLSSIDDMLEPYGMSLQGGPPAKARGNGNGNGNASSMIYRPGQTYSLHTPQENQTQQNKESSEAVQFVTSTGSELSSPEVAEETPENSVQPEYSLENPAKMLDEMGKVLDLPDEEEEKTEIPEVANDEKENDPDDEREFISPHIFEDLSSSHEDSDPASTFGIVGFVKDGVAELTKLATICFIVMILVVFMMYEASRLPKKIIAAFGPRGITSEHLQKIVEKIWKYMLIKSVISFFVGFFVWILLICTKVDYPMLWALIAFFLNFIPNIGSIIAAIPPVALALFDGGFGTFIVVGVGYLVINQGLGYYVEPIFLGDGLGISPLVVLLSLIFWGWLLGLIGMFLSAPLTIVLKIILDSFEETRWVSLLMDDKLRTEKE